MVISQPRPPVGVRRRLLADDGVVLAAEHLPRHLSRGPDGRDLAVVVAHGFTASSRRPANRRIAAWLRTRAGVVLLDLRGHGGSGGVCTMGWQEVRDIDAVVSWARSLGYKRVATLGFSLGAAVVLRHGALRGGVDAVVAVSGPGKWYYVGSTPLLWMQRLVLSPLGRAAIRMGRRTRVSSERWVEPYPVDPTTAAAEITVPLLVVHGDRDGYFPVEHAKRVSGAAGDRATLWLVDGFGHAEGAMDRALTLRIVEWVEAACRR